MELVLIRHPAPIVAPGLCYGSSDLPADPAALAACQEAVAASLHSLLPAATQRAATIYTSPLQRCTALAVRLAAAEPFAGGPPVVDERLAELHFGDWELRAWNDIARAEIDAWAADLLNYRPGGGESVLQAAARVQAFLHAMADAMRSAENAAAIVVCHAGTIRLIQALATGAELHDAALKAATAAHALDYGSIHRVIIE